jgi:hypothetical protein
MSMIEKEKDLIGFANKVISFRMNVIKACRSKGIDVPTDEQLSEYINDYGLHFGDFMADYIEHEGMFRCLRTPLEEFKDSVANINFRVKPTDEEILTFFTNYGNDVGLFCRQHTIKGMKPLVRKTYLKTIGKLSSELLVKLWNTFIEESGLYGSDSHIYDLTNLKDSEYLGKYMDGAQLKTITNMVTQNGTRFIQWLSLKDNSINEKNNDSIENTIAVCWEEIFERIMLYPSCYNFDIELFCKGDASTYFDDVFFPIIAKEVGYIVDGDKGIIKEIENNC